MFGAALAALIGLTVGTPGRRYHFRGSWVWRFSHADHSTQRRHHDSLAIPARPERYRRDAPARSRIAKRASRAGETRFHFTAHGRRGARAAHISFHALRAALILVISGSGRRHSDAARLRRTQPLSRMGAGDWFGRVLARQRGPASAVFECSRRASLGSTGVHRRVDPNLFRGIVFCQTHSAPAILYSM